MKTAKALVVTVESLMCISFTIINPPMIYIKAVSVGTQSHNHNNSNARSMGWCILVGHMYNHISFDHLFTKLTYTVYYTENLKGEKDSSISPPGEINFYHANNFIIIFTLC